MSQYKLPKMSIAQKQYNPATFQGVSFTPQAPDMNILARSLAQAEERHDKAIEKQTAIDIALGDIENELNAVEIPWFNQYKQNIQQQIQNELDNGNYGSAIRVAIKAAGNIKSDTALKGRIKANKDYIKKLEADKENLEYVVSKYNKVLDDSIHLANSLQSETRDSIRVAGLFYSPIPRLF